MKLLSTVIFYAATLSVNSDVAFAKEKKQTAHAALKEDSKYWSRFLEQDSSLPVVTPAPSGKSCDVTVSRTYR
jgi:hypothetical protein